VLASSLSHLQYLAGFLLFRIEIELDDQTYVLAAEDQQAMTTWVEGECSFFFLSGDIVNQKTHVERWSN